MTKRYDKWDHRTARQRRCVAGGCLLAVCFRAVSLSRLPMCYKEAACMKQLVEDIARALVDIPEKVAVRVVEGERVTVLELRVAPSDLGKVIGRQGRTAGAIRTILNAAGMKLKRRFTLEIME